MTTMAPPVVGGRTTTGGGGGAVKGASVTWMSLPALIMFTIFGIIPLVGVLLLSFTSWNGISTQIPFSGSTSWKSVLSDPALPHALWITFKIMIFTWVIQTPASILLGVFMAGHQRYREFLAALFFIPLLLSSAAIAVAYKALLDPNFGLGPGLHMAFLSQDWLGNATLAFWTLMFIVSWQYIPFHSLIYQGAVRQIPKSMYEAAMLDGAGRVRTFWSITLPQLRYVMVTSSTLMIVGSLTFFDLIFVLTAGGPSDATRNLALDMYIRGFQGNQMGLASAIATILVVIGLALALFLRRIGGSGSQLEGA
jgi:raffinose/stachyose/melibiose transport system permease protein